jgi:hypothetical protein
VVPVTSWEDLDRRWSRFDRFLNEVDAHEEVDSSAFAKAQGDGSPESGSDLNGSSAVYQRQE